MARRRRRSPIDQTQMYGSETTYAQQPGIQKSNEDAAKSAHYGNFAWNGEPIPITNSMSPGSRENSFVQQTTASISAVSPQTSMPQATAQMHGTGQQQSYIPQAQQYGAQTAAYGVPAAGSTGDPNAPYGQRNTGVNHADGRNIGFQGGYTGYGSAGTPVQYGTFMRDGTQYGKGPHTIDPKKAIISAVHYEDGGISAVRFQDGSVAGIAQAIQMAEQGLIEDVNTGRNREGQKTLRSYPDGDPSNNLSNLPRF